MTAAPLQIELSFELSTSPNDAFDLLSNRLPEWFSAIHAVRWDHSRSKAGDQVGECSERVCDFGGKALREVIAAYEPGRHYAYRVDLSRSTLQMPLQDHLGTFDVAATERGSKIVWRQHFRARWFVPAALLRWQMRERMMRPAVEGLIARYGGRWVSAQSSAPAPQ